MMWLKALSMIVIIEYLGCDNFIVFKALNEKLLANGEVFGVHTDTHFTGHTHDIYTGTHAPNFTLHIS